MKRVLVIACGFFKLKHTPSLGMSFDDNRVLKVRVLTQTELATNVVACVAKILNDEGYDVRGSYGFLSREALQQSLRICSEHRDRVLRLAQQLNWYRSKDIQLHSNDGINIYITYEEV